MEVVYKGLSLNFKDVEQEAVSQEISLQDLRKHSLQVVMVSIGVANFFLFTYAVYARLIFPEASTILFVTTFIWFCINWFTYTHYDKGNISSASKVLISGLIIVIDCLLLIPGALSDFYPYLYLVTVAISGLLITPQASFAVAIIGPLTGLIIVRAFIGGGESLTSLIAPTTLSIVMALITWAGSINLLTSYRWAIESRMRASNRRDELFESQQELKKANELLETANLRLAQREAELRKARAELEILVADLQRLNINKDKFFSIVAHDLKGPFMPLLGTSELLVEMADFLEPNEVKELGSSLNRSASSVYNLLENLLQWARMQMGRIEYKPIRFDVTTLIQQNIDLLFENAVTKQINLQTEIKYPIYVQADQNMIDTVIRNLISNALKFTPPEGSITILATLLPKKTVNNQEISLVQLSVTDTGIGIPPDDVDKLFKIEVHHTTLGTNNEKGTGLGLVMCQEMVQKNGGQIWVESEIGQGTTFHFTIPLDTSMGVIEEALANDEAIVPGHNLKPAAPEEILPPSSEELLTLLDLARIGDMEAIKKRANTLKEGNINYDLFSQKLVTLAQDFDEQAILQLLDGALSNNNVKVL